MNSPDFALPVRLWVRLRVAVDQINSKTLDVMQWSNSIPWSLRMGAGYVYLSWVVARRFAEALTPTRQELFHPAVAEEIPTWGWTEDWAYARARLVGETLSDSSVYPDEFST